MHCFAVVTYVSSFLLSDCYRSPHSVIGTKTYSYMDAVRVNLGRNQTWVCGFLQYLIMFGTGIAYVITTSTCMRAKQRSSYLYKEGCAVPRSYGDTFYMLLFGAVQIFVSQIRNFHNMAWLSIVVAVMSFSYSFIGLGLGFTQVVGYIKVTTSGKLDYEESIDDGYSYHHLLLSLLWMLPICGLWRPDTRKSFNRVQILLALLAYRLCQCLHCCSSSWRISGIFA
ncbi:hypothetical protein GIB67_038673 [Kingdonia uniflora]|uniref:Amino acid transporter transmembrane domain-containing protein n=1 Tax=Kingdonia uniflora TaxID=39325 RepID=A0A7J7NSW5_9MAGN|nr:hypothetical protein GIB67_038673 [Kingdonia uniflora]